LLEEPEAAGLFAGMAADAQASEVALGGWLSLQGCRTELKAAKRIDLAGM